LGESAWNPRCSGVCGDNGLTRAEKLAKLAKLARGGFHPFRRMWASERRHLPAQDVAAAGGWRSLEVMRHAYQHADAAGMMSVVERDRPETPVTPLLDEKEESA
jgi:hypothetical protein